MVAANAQALRTTGYAASQLAGQDFTVLTGPETDPAALAALQRAARQNQPYQTQLRCRTEAGRPFWFGLQLMPANEQGAPVRSLIAGRDITLERREREQDQAVQSLLAKVFITMDVPVYILDPQGRFLMTNPALDRLLGCRPGALAGKPEPERYASRSHAALAAARAQQDVDGLDYTIEAALRGPGGDGIACSITCATVQRADLPRLRVTTIRTEPPGADAPRITAGGRIQLIGLEEIRQTLGPKWAGLKDRAMAAAEHVLQRHLGRADTFSRTEDQGFVVCFAEATEDEAIFRSAMIAREMRRRLIGLGETPEVAHVFSAATALPPEAQGLSASELAAMVRDRIARRLREIQEAARARLVEVLEEATYDTEPVRARGRTEPVGVLLRIPEATERAVEAAVAVLPSAETAALDMDAMLLGFAHQYATESATQHADQLIFVPLSSDILLVRKRMEACVEACRAIPDRLRQRLVLTVLAPPEEAARQLSNGVARLRPFSRSIGVALDTLDPVELDAHAHGIAILLLDAAACRVRGWEGKAKARTASLHAPRCRLMVRGAAAADVAELFAAGADLVSSQPES